MKIGFIGCGNMASAMIGGIIKNQVVAPADILASAKTEVSREKKKEELGIAMTADNREVAAFAEVLILAVKPFYYEDVIKEIRDVVADDTIVVSIAPGKKLILKNVSQETLKNLIVPIPPQSLLNQFNDSILPIYNLINSNTKENVQLITLRDWLLPMLMNGQTTIED